MKIDAPRAQSTVSVLLVLTSLCLGTTTAEEGKVRTVGARKVPPPLGASAELRQSIAASPQPDVKAVSSVSPKSALDWKKIIASRGMSHGGWMNEDFPESRAFTSEVAVFLKRHMK